MAQVQLSAVGEIVRRHDPDRFFTTLFAPPMQRETLWTLYAFNHELARAREMVREPFAALIRLQWWRDVVEGARPRHEVAGPVGLALDEGRLLPSDLAGMVDAREAEADGIADLAAFEAYAMGTAGGLMVAAGRALGFKGAEALRQPGAAYGVAGVLRNAAVLAGEGRSVLAPGLTSGEGRAGLVALGRGWLASPVQVPRRAIAAALPVVLARRDLARGAEGGRSVGDRLAVVRAAALGRV